MKKAVLITLILTIKINANAMCGWAGINVWPTEQNIAANSIFVIEGYSQSQELIRQLNKKNKIYLTCNKERIPIKVLKIVEGQYSLTQAILKPDRELTIGKTYELYIDSLGMFDKDEFKVVKWTVDSISDTEKPIWNCIPKYKGKSYSSYGCGPVKYVNFCGSFKDNSPTLIYVKVFDKKNNTSSDYYLTSNKQIISIGHGMCSGEFSFDKETNYEVQFGLMDASGNENLELTESINFTSPNKDNQSNKEFNCSCADNSNLLIYCLLGLGIFGFAIMIYKKRKNTSS